MVTGDLTWQDFLDHLTKSLLHDGTLTSSFKGLCSDRERGEFCRTHSSISMQIDDWLTVYLHGNKENYFQKDINEMLQLKTNGNKEFVARNDEKAIELYNSALLCAPKTESALLYGNRSAVFFSQGLWQKCITDIEVAITLNFPGERLWKLLKRKGEALANIGRFIESNKQFQKAMSNLKYSEENVHVAQIEKCLADNKKRMIKDARKENRNSSNEMETITPIHGWCDNISYGSSCLTIHHDDEQGRYVVANRDILSGSIILSEKPYAAVLLSPWYKTHCTHCFVRVCVPFACHECSQIVYCSEECRKSSWEEYHYFECLKLDLLENIGIARLALRIYLITPKTKLYRFKDNNFNVLTKTTGCDNKGVYKGDYESVFNLLTHSDKMAVEDLFQYSAAGVLLLRILMMDQSQLVKIGEDFGHVGSLLIRHILQLVCNAHAVTSLNDTLLTKQDSSNIIEQDQVRIATAIYPTTSLLNHSCEPTVINCFQRDRLIVKTVRCVKAGEQIYNCYGPHYRRMDFTERQKALNQQYYFDCKCSHCLAGISADSLLNNYRCDSCNSSLSDHEPKCDVIVSERLSHCKAQREISRKSFKKGLEMLRRYRDNSNMIQNALRLFTDCVQIQEKVLFKHHKELSETYDVMARCYALLADYEQCIPYIAKSVTITEMHFGSDSVEVTNELLKLSDVYMAAMQCFIDSKQSRDQIKRHLTGACKVVEKTISLVAKNKEPGCEDMMLLQERLESLVKLKYMSR